MARNLFFAFVCVAVLQLRQCKTLFFMQRLPRHVWRVVEQYLTPARIHVSCSQTPCSGHGRVILLQTNGVEVYMDDGSDPLRFDFGFNEPHVSVFGPLGLQLDATYVQSWCVTSFIHGVDVCTNVGDVLVVQRAALTQALQCV